MKRLMIGVAHESMTVWAQSQRGKEVFLYRCYDFGALPPMSLCWNLAAAREYCLQFADEATEGTRKQLAQGQVALEPQICLAPDPGDRAESHLSSVTQHLLQGASERSLS